MSEAFELPLGVISNGAVHKDIVLTPMTAGIRRGLLSRSNQKNPTSGLTDMFCKCCESLAGAPPTPQVLNSLTTGDRDFILLMIRKISIGESVHGQIVCPRCQTEISFDLNLDDIHVRRLEPEKDFRIEGSWAIKDVSSEELGLEVSFRFPVAHDQIAITERMRQDPGLANYELYGRILKRWVKNGEEEPHPNTIKFIDNLPVKDIEWLEEEFRKAVPGPEWLVNLTCEVCGRRSPMDLSDTDFLFKTQR